MRQKSVSRMFSFIVPVFIIALLIPWNNGDVGNSLRKDIDNTLSNPQPVDLRNFPVLRISKDDLLALFKKQAGQSRVHKLVFKFNINDAQTLNPSLTIFRAQQNDRKYLPNLPAVSPTLARVNQTCEITGEYTLGNLELHKNDWATILARVGGNTYLYFYPTKEQYNGVGLYNIVYKLYWGNDAAPYECDAWMKLAPPPPPDGGLNPSPPADPS
jgi:hypothetical protein